jgi:hypothetical protein
MNITLSFKAFARAAVVAAAGLGVRPGSGGWNDLEHTPVGCAPNTAQVQRDSWVWVSPSHTTKRHCRCGPQRRSS